MYEHLWKQYVKKSFKSKQKWKHHLKRVCKMQEMYGVSPILVMILRAGLQNLLMTAVALADLMEFYIRS